MVSLPKADLPLTKPATGSITLEWYTVLQRMAQNIVPEVVFVNRENGFWFVLKAPSATMGSNILQVLGFNLANPGGINIHTPELPTADNQRFGFVVMGAYDTTGRNAAAVTAFSEGAWTSGVSHPCSLRLETTASGSATRTERMRIQGDGKIRLQAPSFTANGAGAVTITALRPAAALVATITRWLTFVDEAGVTSYIPVWQ